MPIETRTLRLHRLTGRLAGLFFIALLAHGRLGLCADVVVTQSQTFQTI